MTASVLYALHTMQALMSVKASEERKSCIPHLKSSYPETYHMENLAITFVQSPQRLEPSGQISLKSGLG